jgi:two-component system LytT family response regulator
MAQAVLIDDDVAARERLRELLRAHSVNVVGESGQLTEACRLLARSDYNLVFIDVELRGGIGFNILTQIRPEARVVFVTAHERFAVRAFEANALDYLLKPVQAPRLAASLARFAAVRPAPCRSFTIDDSVFVKIDAGAMRFVRLRDLAAIFSSENYTELHLADSTKLVVRRTLKAWEQQLPASEFMRVHRTAIVNLRAVRRSAHHDREITHLYVVGRAEEPVRARRELWSEIERRLDTINRYSS